MPVTLIPVERPAGTEATPPPAARKPPALAMRGITKQFPGVLANDHIDLDVRPGEILALLGENGAGKSTLMNILYGLLQPDEGEVLIDGQPVRIAGPSDAIARGIGMVHQHFMLIPVFSVAENIMLGDETMANPVALDAKRAESRIDALARQFGFEIDPRALVGELSVGIQQRVEILKALYRGARILILDEPTAVLTPQETVEIFAVLRRLAAEGTSIVFISHKLYEVLAIADRIMVIRSGRVVGEADPRTATEEQLAEMMVGREVSLTVEKGPAKPGDVVLAVEGLAVADDRGSTVVQGCSFEVRAGEILGIAGVAGNGQVELVEALVGLRHARAGSIALGGTTVTNHSVRDLTGHGLAYIPGDRQRFGLVLSYPIDDNLVLTDYYHPPYSRFGVLNERAISERAAELIQAFDIRTPSATASTSTLSGGNQQKVIVAREFSRDVTLLVADQPTRGLDVGSIEFIHTQIVAKRDAGAAVLLVSAELDEIMELSDRIAVIYRGRLVTTIDAAGAEKERIGLIMATGEDGAAAGEGTA
jgi:simple sugar transport system ATP-binding protein